MQVLFKGALAQAFERGADALLAEHAALAAAEAENARVLNSRLETHACLNEITSQILGSQGTGQHYWSASMRMSGASCRDTVAHWAMSVAPATCFPAALPRSISNAVSDQGFLGAEHSSNNSQVICKGFVCMQGRAAGGDGGRV